MTLLELLVRDLERWPLNATECSNYPKSDIYAWIDTWIDTGIGVARMEAVTRLSVIPSERVTREQYEAALAASKHAEWDGNGKPSIGVTCEHCPGGTTQTEWEVVTVLGISKRPGGMFTDYWLRKEDGSSYIIGNPYRFRPIRTEAERKRKEIAQQMCNLFGNGIEIDEK